MITLNNDKIEPVKILLSSTTEDLRYARTRLREGMVTDCPEIKLICYEDEAHKYPGINIQEACLKLVEECQAIILLMDRKYGARYQKTPKISILMRNFSKVKN